MEISDIKAGTYLLVAKLWDEFTSKPGEPFDFTRHRRGAVLDLKVDDARRLYLAGAVVPHDPENPTYAVHADGTVTEILPPDPAATGMVIGEEHLAVLSDQLGIPAGATSEDIVRAVQRMQAETQAAQQAALTAQQAAQQAQQPPPTDRPTSDRIGDILAWVSQDRAKAEIALNGEKTSKGANARPQLVSALEEILTAPAGG